MKTRINIIKTYLQHVALTLQSNKNINANARTMISKQISEIEFNLTTDNGDWSLDEILSFSLLLYKVHQNLPNDTISDDLFKQIEENFAAEIEADLVQNYNDLQHLMAHEGRYRLIEHFKNTNQFISIIGTTDRFIALMNTGSLALQND